MVEEQLEKSPFQSKKFIAFFLAEATWKIVLALALVIGLREGHMSAFLGAVVLPIVLISGFVEALYIGGQAALDKYVRVAQIAAGAGQDVDMKNLSLKAKKKDGEKSPQGDQT